MRIAALYDIHGNLPALEAVLREIESARIDRIVVGGDVLPGPMPCETLALLATISIPTTFISGNGEAAVLKVVAGQELAGVPAQAREAIRWNAEQLQPEHVRAIERWPATANLHAEGIGDLLFCHATPRSDTEIFTKLTPDEQLAPMLAGADAALIVCGHTHMQFDRRVGDIRVANAGSVGMPFGDPGAYWLLLEEDVYLQRTDYDVEAAAARVRASAYPQAEEFAARNIVRPPSEREILEAWADSANAPLRGTR